jgi:outer membrane protein TolC
MDGHARNIVVIGLLASLVGCYHGGRDVLFENVCYVPPVVECCSTETHYGPFDDPAYRQPPMASLPAPAAVREQIPLTLAEAQRLALENNKEIAVIGYIPDEIQTFVQAEYGLFDTIIGAAIQGGKDDTLVSSEIESDGSLFPFQITDSLSPLDENELFVRQHFRTGGDIEFGLSTDYTSLDPVGSFTLVNPAWDSALNLSIEQPLFKGAGFAVNDAPISIARSNHQQSQYDFQALVRTILRDVEVAYWNVYLAAQQVDIRRDSLRQASLTFQREQDRLDIGDSTVPDVAEAEEQYLRFEVDFAESELFHDDSQRTLLRLLGLPSDYANQIAPETAPEVQPMSVDWAMAVATAQQRPEILAQHAAICAAETNVFLAQNGMAPDISVFFDYSVTGLADRFDDSMEVLGDNDYNEWVLGLAYIRPLGRITENATLRRARLALGRELAGLDSVEHDIMHELHQAYQELMTAQRVLDLHFRRVQAANREYTARAALYENPPPDAVITLDLLVESEARLTEARLADSSALATYQTALVNWRYASGAIFDGRVVVQDSTSIDESLNVPVPAPMITPLP